MSKGKRNRARDEAIKAQQMRQAANARRLGKKQDTNGMAAADSPFSLNPAFLQAYTDSMNRMVKVMAGRSWNDLLEPPRPKVNLRKPEPTPLFTDCIVGYRAWTVDAYGDLRPVTKTGHPWQPGVNTATCARGEGGSAIGRLFISTWADLQPPAPADHQAPHEHCGCGLYARFSPAVSDGNGSTDPKGASPVLLGSIAAWGDIRVHRDGFRAEKAQITALALHPTSAAMEGADRLRALAASIAARYGVPLVDAADLTREGEMHGEPLPESAIPKPEPGHTRWIA